MDDRDRISLLVVEDNRGDYRLVQIACGSQDRVAIDITCAESLQEAGERLSGGGFDLILLDVGLPDVDGLEALHTLRRTQPDLPVILLTGLNDQDVAHNALKAGAQDYIVKGTFSGDSLVRACLYAIERFQLVRDLEENNAQLRAALRRINSLEKLLPICAYCKNIRGGDGSWTPVENFLEDATAKQLTHGICPTCLRRQTEIIESGPRKDQ